MPNLKLTLPENENPSHIALQGERITIGRLADNAIQIRDRRVSAHHAELVYETDHYCLRDRGATNGIRVDGRIVNDYHLRESCRIDLGGIECEFHVTPPPPEVKDEEEKLATRAEVNAAWRECEALRHQLELAREELDRLRKAATSEREALQGEFAQLTAQCHQLQLDVKRRDSDIHVLQTGLRLLRRERQNLQSALDEILNAGLSAARATPLPKPPRPLQEVSERTEKIFPPKAL
jgi:pSer/pThr/pTyr-binding forkhead associated (FHA) protein